MLAATSGTPSSEPSSVSIATVDLRVELSKTKRSSACSNTSAAISFLPSSIQGRTFNESAFLQLKRKLIPSEEILILRSAGRRRRYGRSKTKLIFRRHASVPRCPEVLKRLRKKLQ